MDGCDTDTERSASPLGKPRRQVQKAVNAAGRKPQVAKNVASAAELKVGNSERFVEQFATKLQAAQAVGRGCAWCGFQCFTKLQQYLSDLLGWRKQFRDLTVEAADRELLWLFRRSGSSSALGKHRNHGAGKADGHRDQQLESSTETEQSEQDIASRSRPRKCLKLTRESSGTGTEHSEEQPAGAQEKVDVQLSGTSTSSETADSGHLDLRSPQSSTVSVAKAKAKAHVRQYATRVGAKQPSVSLQRILPSATEDCMVCRQSGMFFLGIGRTRLQRAAWSILSEPISGLDWL